MLSVFLSIISILVSILHQQLIIANVVDMSNGRTVLKMAKVGTREWLYSFISNSQVK